MKTMTCTQLGGACDLEFHADTFDEIAEQSKAHGTEMFEKSEPAHLQAMQEMQSLMQSPGAMQKWFEEKRAEFNALPEY
jgi:predicted small metal-binding protein